MNSVDAIDSGCVVCQGEGAKDKNRFPACTISTSGLILDYSKNQIADEDMAMLIRLAREKGIIEQRDAMYAGERINVSEERAVLHTALRSIPTEQIFVDGENVEEEVQRVLEKMHVLTERIHTGEWKGYTDKTITDIVNIGIGGSDLGPRMVTTALRAYWTYKVNVHFVSNADGHDLYKTLQELNPETTLFIISSKSFTTEETMLNARMARTWFLNHKSTVETDLAKHFIAVTSNIEAAETFGIEQDNIYPIWDWVGGRFSVWSAIGLPVMLAIGADHFREFLSGAHSMDIHFKNAPLERNMPVVLAMIGIWNRNYLNYHSLAVAPYHDDFSIFSRWLQQLEMESNGKSVQKNGEPVTGKTCPIILGNTGTNGQHSYFQLFHQGTDICPVDFIVALKPSHPYDRHHQFLLANCFAQAEALMIGRDEAKVRAEMERQGLPEDKIKELIKQKQFKGGRPSNMILMNQLRPETLGALMALYEHKVFVQGVIWNINSFDQMGVELGKALATNIHRELVEGIVLNHDSSTMGLIELAKKA